MIGRRKRRILIDLRVLPMDGSPGAGIAHAARELFEEMGQRASFFGIELIGAMPKGACVERTSESVFLEDSSGSSLRNAVDQAKVEGVFVPSGAVPVGLRVPAYPWVHDVAIFDHSDWFPQGFLRRQLTTRLFLRGVKQAPHVFTISEDTKRALIRLTGLPDERITVTWQGCRPATSALPTQPPYALFIGTVEPRKNLPFLLALWPRVRQAVPGAELVIAGGNGWGNVELFGEGVRRVEIPDDASRDQWLAGATMLVFPSLHEGFGRPALEAMSMGVPVLASDCGALPEVIGDGGRSFPLVEDLWVKQIVRWFVDKADRQAWSEAGRRRAPFFSWQKTADLVLAKLSEG